MSYIGNPPLTGSYKKLDDISSGFNGSTTTFNLTSSSDAVTPGSPNALIISLGGVVQEPTSSYTVSGSTITFTTAPAASTTFWGVMLGDTLYVGVSQGTVTPSMLSTGGPSWDTSGNATVSGNLTLSGTAKRITGDFSNATVASRVMFQTSTANSNTTVRAIPNGSGVNSGWIADNNSDVTNSSYAQFGIVGTTDVRIQSAINGTGTYLPMTFYTGGSERMRIDTSGNVGIGTNENNRLSFTYNGGTGAATIGPNSTSGNTYLTFGTSSSGTYSEAMRIDSSGRVGIGTSTPAAGYSLTANGSTIVGNGTDITPTASWGGQLTISGSGYSGGLAMDASGIWLGNNSASRAVIFATNETERVRITANGGVAFGGASNYGTSGQVLTSNGDAAPTWGTVSGTPAGSVVAFAGSSAPSGWLLCSGAAVSRSTYAALFAVIGTTYGAGDGSTTFNLPDMRGRSAFGVDNMGGTAANRITSGGSGITGTTLGAAGGAETVTLSTSQIPSHNHYPTSNLGSPGNNGFNGYVYFNFTNSGSAGSSYPMSSTGGGGAHNNTPPAIILNYIIKT